MPPDVAAMTVPLFGDRLTQFMRDYRHMASFGFLIEDSSEGRVVNLPFLGPTIFYNFTKRDVERMRKGVSFLTRLFLEGGASKVYTMIQGYTEVSSMEELKRLEEGKIEAKDIGSMAFHPLGTCRMSFSSDHGVVGLDQQVFGWEGVYVADGSVIPSSLGVNPQITIMAFANRLASGLLASIY